MDLAQIWQYLRHTSCKQLLIVLRTLNDEGKEVGRSMAFAEMPAGINGGNIPKELLD